ncbi:type III PLP-dependent enzyme domain-containing protein [Streptomyces hawaiiensis]|uniref:type III PLP-dependent enzyme n=1 Tax=Streptomyces hawaiiensis TaxID=67305 RepID=UPI003648DA04
MTVTDSETLARRGEDLPVDAVPLQEDLPALVARYGSPLYVYELGKATAAVASLSASLPKPSALYYSLKANPHPRLARTMRAVGCRAEISSEGELAVALEAGFDPADCLYTGPGKTADEIAAALDAGVLRFSVESEGDHGRVARTAADRGKTAECLLRVNADDARGTSGLRMTGKPSQFGIDSAMLTAAPERFAARPGARPVGLHFFALSNARSPEDLLTSLRSCIVEAARVHRETGLPLEIVDLGGGFAAPYAAEGGLPDYTALREPLEEALDKHLPGWRDGAPRIAFESGRHLVGGAGRLVCTVGDVKESRGHSYVVVDTGIHHLGGLAGLGRLLPLNASPTQLGTDGGVGPQPLVSPVALVGPLCTPADVLTRNTTLADVTPGSILSFPNVGAYGLTASLLGFLSRPVAAEVVLDGGTPVDASRLEIRRVPLAPLPDQPWQEAIK